MRRWQMIVIWIAALALSLTLFGIGIGKPYLNSRRLIEDPPPLVTEVDPRYEEVQADTASASPNYVVGVLAPAGILLGSIVLFSLVPMRDGSGR